mmetsp:Transcript_64758/g.173716  ORF Transcript_64758/g.173716 Transcript_64758/m.173716 type:complete len:236 (+) Transcript_64758:5702-6409(+)
MQVSFPISTTSFRPLSSTWNKSQNIPNSRSPKMLARALNSLWSFSDSTTSNKFAPVQGTTPSSSLLQRKTARTRSFAASNRDWNSAIGCFARLLSFDGPLPTTTICLKRYTSCCTPPAVKPPFASISCEMVAIIRAMAWSTLLLYRSKEPGTTSSTQFAVKISWQSSLTSVKDGPDFSSSQFSLTTFMDTNSAASRVCFSISRTAASALPITLCTRPSSLVPTIVSVSNPGIRES